MLGKDYKSHQGIVLIIKDSYNLDKTMYLT